MASDWIVRVRHSGGMTSDRDEHSVVFGPDTEAECKRVAKQCNKDHSGPGSTSHYYAEPA